MHYKKFVSALVGVAACAAMAVTDASAQPSRGGGRRYGGGTIGRAAPRVVDARTFGPRTRGFYPGRIHTGRIAPRIVNYYPYRSYYHPYRSYRPGFSVGLYRGFGYPYRYGRYAYPYNGYYSPYYSSYYYRYPRSVFRNVPYGWLHATVPYGYVTTVPGHYYSHGRVWTDTTDDASTATTTSDR
jgi:hypothetical protein